MVNRNIFTSIVDNARLAIDINDRENASRIGIVRPDKNFPESPVFHFRTFAYHLQISELKEFKIIAYGTTITLADIAAIIALDTRSIIR